MRENSKFYNVSDKALAVGSLTVKTSLQAIQAYTKADPDAGLK